MKLSCSQTLLATWLAWSSCRNTLVVVVQANVFAHLTDSSWVDPTTPDSVMTVTGMKDKRKLTLVFSDEFNDAGRTFADGEDTRWTSEDRPATTNAALHYYNSSHVSTKNGKLFINTTRVDNASWVEYDPQGVEYHWSRNYVSGMLSTWNKFCFTSGMIEISVQLPGDPGRGGLWPAFWMLGNLARPSYMSSTEGIWPWSYNTCGKSEESINANKVQRINNCENGRGRGSPEIDIIEAQPGDFILEYDELDYIDGKRQNITVGRPMISSSLQLAPGVDDSRRVRTPSFPAEGQWYPDLYPFGGEAYGGLDNTDSHRMLNNFWYGQLIEDDPPVWQDGMSLNWQHSHSYYQQQTVIRTEWQAGKDDGYVRFFNGEGQLVYEITSQTLKNKPGANDTIPLIPYEAMYLILNTDVSPRWGWNGCDPTDECMKANNLCSPEGELTCKDCGNPDCLKCPETTGWLADFCEDIDPSKPAQYLIDYVRVYQDTSDPMHTLGCNPPDLPTKEIIEENWEHYTFNAFLKEAPLLKVTHGGGACKDDTECQGSVQQEGVCEKGKCSCPDDWTGPKCQSPCIGDYAGACAGDTESEMAMSDPPSSVPSDIPSMFPSDIPSEIPSLSPSKIPSLILPPDTEDAPSESPAVFDRLQTALSAAPTVTASPTLTLSPSMHQSLTPTEQTPNPTVAETEAPVQSAASRPASYRTLLTQMMGCAMMALASFHVFC